jgi:uncharacterized protein with PQ loop repeat
MENPKENVDVFKKVPWWGRVNSTLSFEPIGKNYKESTKMIMATSFMLIILVEASFLFIQAGEMYSKKSAKDVSIVAFIVLFAASLFWIFYTTTFIGSVAVLLSSVLYAVGSLLIIIGVIKYGDAEENNVEISPS